MTEQPDMRKTFLQSKLVSSAPEAVAPDGSDVRLLCQTQRGSMAHFTLRAGAVSKAVAHRTIDELWYFVSGRGRMWRRLDDLEEVTAVKAGISIAIPVGTHFQFRSDSPEALAAVGVTMPPWPGEGEAYDVKGYWDPTV